MKKLTYLFILILLTNCKVLDNSSNTIKLAELIVEHKDNKQINSLKKKIKAYELNPKTVFLEDGYYYDTQNKKNQVFRGNSDDIKKDVEWFLLIDNLMLKNYLAELDISFSKEDVEFNLNLLAQKKSYELPEHTKIPKEQHKFSGSYLAYYSDALNKKGLTLINFYINGDSYVTALVKKRNLNKIIEIAQRTGNKITEYNIQNIDKL